MGRILIFIEQAGMWVWKNRFWVIPAGEFIVKGAYKGVKYLIDKCHGKRDSDKDCGDKTGPEA